MRILIRIVDGIFITFAGMYFLIDNKFASILYPLVLLIFTAINIEPSFSNFKIKNFKLRICAGGADLLTSFLISFSLTVIVLIKSYSLNSFYWWLSLLLSLIYLIIVFWNGIIRVYVTSVQLGINHRIIGLICGWIPVANIISLCTIIYITSKEVDFENQKIIQNEKRKNLQICKTKYPILLVHGVFFRDYKYFNYWGRIPKELEANGAKIYYGNHQSALPVNQSGIEIAERIKVIVQTTGCEKVNIIAHSKGGLDTRYAISCCDCAEYVASLTTISTPHRGCEFVDFLLNKLPEKAKTDIAESYNNALRKFGETPDFLSAVKDLTYESCQELNNTMQDSDKVFYQSVGSKQNKARNGRFPTNLSYTFVRFFDKENDGLVSKDSFIWGNNFLYLTVKGNRGISHADTIDLNRENIPDFDVREFYVKLVSDLKQKGF